jgi:hypothetical protein
MYRIRGTVKGLKLFISLFTGHEPVIRENVWPFRGWRVGVSSEIAIDTVVLPPVNLAHAFIVEMPVSYKDLAPESVIRIHEIIQLERPANTQYYLRFAVEEKKDELREFMVIGTRSGIGVGGEGSEAITSEAELQALLDRQGREEQRAAKPKATAAGTAGPAAEADDPFEPRARTKKPLPKAPRADNAPVEGKEVRTGEAGGFGSAAREMQAISESIVMEAVDPSGKTRVTKLADQPTDINKTREQKPAGSEKTMVAEPPKKKPEASEKKPEAKKPDDDKKK